MGVAECFEVSDIDFPRQPLPQRLSVSDPRLSSELFEHRAKRGEFVLPLVPIARNVLAKDEDVRIVEKAMDAIAQTPSGRRRRRRWQTKSANKMRRQQRLIFQQLGTSNPRATHDQ